MGACGAVGRPGQEADGRVGGVRHWGRSNTDMEKQRARVSMYVELAGAPQSSDLVRCRSGGGRRSALVDPRTCSRPRSPRSPRPPCHHSMDAARSHAVVGSERAGGAARPTPAGAAGWCLEGCPAPLHRAQRRGATDYMRWAHWTDQHPASSIIQHLASSIWHPASSTQRPPRQGPARIQKTAPTPRDIFISTARAADGSVANRSAHGEPSARRRPVQDSHSRRRPVIPPCIREKIARGWPSKWCHQRAALLTASHTHRSNAATQQRSTTAQRTATGRCHLAGATDSGLGVDHLLQRR